MITFFPKKQKVYPISTGGLIKDVTPPIFLKLGSFRKTLGYMKSYIDALLQAPGIEVMVRPIF